jgi:hypothetical protein
MTRNKTQTSRGATRLALFNVVALILLLGSTSLWPVGDSILPSAHAARAHRSGMTLNPLTSGSQVARLRAADPCDPIPGQDYPETWLNPPPSDRPAATHPDLNLIVRGYTPSNAEKGFVYYYGNTDEGAPQLSGLFGDDRLGVISSAYRIHDWEWGLFQRGKTISDPEVTLVGLQATPGEIIYLPPSGYTIGEGFNAVILYADPLRLTIKYTREDNVVSGYTLHLENICPEPRLLAVYENCNNNARGHLPALYAGHALGRARGDELGVAIRDNGDFMDPRSSKDWWVR